MRNRRLRADLHRALGNILGEIADPFEVAADADGANELAQVSRHRLAARDGRHRHVLDFALQSVEAQIGRDDPVCEHTVGVGQRVHGVDDHFPRDAAHFNNSAFERVELPAEGLDGMFDQGSHSLSRNGRRRNPGCAWRVAVVQTALVSSHNSEGYRNTEGLPVRGL